MAALIEAIDIKRKMFFEYEGAPYHCIDVEVSRPTARGGQTLVRVKMRNLLTRAVFDRTFKAGEKFAEPDLVKVTASYLYADSDGYHFMDQETYETLTLSADMLGDDRLLLVDNIVVADPEVQRQPDRPAVPAARGADGRPHGARHPRRHRQRQRHEGATLETGLEIRVPLFIKEGERVKVHTETREFAGEPESGDGRRLPPSALVVHP